MIRVSNDTDFAPDFTPSLGPTGRTRTNRGHCCKTDSVFYAYTYISVPRYTRYDTFGINRYCSKIKNTQLIELHICDLTLTARDCSQTI